MLRGDELREAREAAGMTQEQLGNAVGRTLRSVGNWERGDRVPAAVERQLRREFPEWFGAPASPLTAVSDGQLLAEIARRFERGRQERDGDGSGNTASSTRAGDARDAESADAQQNSRAYTTAVTTRGRSTPANQEVTKRSRD